MRYGVVMETLYFTSKNSNIPNSSLYPASVGTGVLVCGQSIIYQYLSIPKEDYYVQEIDFFGFIYFGAECSR